MRTKKHILHPLTEEQKVQTFIFDFFVDLLGKCPEFSTNFV